MGPKYELRASPQPPRWRISPITLRIMAVNIGALLILAFGLLYTAQYENDLTHAELGSLMEEGRLIAAALAFEGMTGGVHPSPSAAPVLTEEASRRLLQKFAENNALHIVLFGKTGKMLLDSRQLPGETSSIQFVTPAAPFSVGPLENFFSFFIQKLLKYMPVTPAFPLYPKGTGAVSATDTDPDISATLKGESSSSAWYDKSGRILLIVSQPVRVSKNVLGAVMLSRDGDNIEQAVWGVQLTVLKFFMGALLTTILLSLYLSETIGAPILKLAAAAEKVRQSLLLKDALPDLSYRHDEIGLLSVALRGMTFELAERIDAIGNFAADVAHEIKNPLASLKSAVETFSIITDPANQGKLLSIIKNDVDRINRLITDISMASRLDSEIGRTEKKTFDFAMLLKNLIEIETVNAGVSGRIFLNLDKNRKLWVTGNEERLSQVIHNLISNAISFLPAAGKITATGFFQEGKVIVHIDNDGPEIPEKKLEAIFERFYSERPESEKFGLHSGLGLSISRQIVRAHQGALRASNIRDAKWQHQAVRFTIILPAGGAT